jgi:hypothetical protein
MGEMQKNKKKEFPYYPKIGQYVGTALVKSTYCDGLILIGMQKTKDGLKVDAPFHGHSSTLYVDGLKLKYERVEEK